MNYGLIGESLPHSFSPEIHRLLGNPDYVIKELTREELPSFMEGKNFKGINVTIPYKQDVIPYLDEIDAPSKSIGAVNTILNKDGKLYGYNTDYYGFARLLSENGISLQGKKVLILGTGGTSKTVRAVCKDSNAAVVVRASRSGKPEGASEDDEDIISYNQAYEEYSDAEIILNTTPCGMFPKVEASPISLDVFTCLEAAADVIYNPLTTQFVMDVRSKGISAVNGLPMLVYQAEKAEEIWGVDLTGGMKGEEVAAKLISDKRNIVLAGMPGSGKTTISKLLADSLGRELVDTDEYIIRMENRSIADIFATDGELYFRDLETKVCKELMTRTGLIISTGGGLILRPENVSALKRNGLIVYLDRDITKIIAGNGRPLAKSPEDIKRLYDERHEFYEKAADITVKVDGTPIDTAKETENAFFNY